MQTDRNTRLRRGWRPGERGSEGGASGRERLNTEEETDSRDGEEGEKYNHSPLVARIFQ